MLSKYPEGSIEYKISNCKLRPANSFICRAQFNRKRLGVKAFEQERRRIAKSQRNECQEADGKPGGVRSEDQSNHWKLQMKSSQFQSFSDEAGLPLGTLNRSR